MNLFNKMKQYALLAAVSMGAINANAQAINESFDDITTLTAAGWVMNNLSTPIGTQASWFQSTTTPFPAFGGTGYIAANYNNVAGAADISNWLITPARTFNNGDVVTFYSRTTTPGGTVYPDRLEVRLSVNGTSTNVGTTNSSVGDFTNVVMTINPTLTTTGYPSTWTQYTINVSGLPMAMTGRLAFRYYVTNGGPTGANSDFIGIDNFVYTPVGTPAAPNMDVTAFAHQYVYIPQSQVTSMNLGATVANVGTANATNAMITAKVFVAPNFTVPVQTTTSPATAVNTGANTTLSAGTYTPSAIGTYLYQYIVSATGDTDATNDTLEYIFAVTDTEYAREDGSSSQAVGAGVNTKVIFLNSFVINAATTLDSVFFATQTQAAGDSVQAVVYSAVAGAPGTRIGQSAVALYTAADVGVAAVKTLRVTNMSSGALTLAPGTYFIGFEEDYSGDVDVLASSYIVTPNTFYVNINGGPFSEINTLIAFPYTPIMRGILQVPCTIAASATQNNATCNGLANGNATASSTGGSGSVSYVWSNGQTTAMATGLMAGTYSFTATDANSCASSGSVTITQPTALTSSANVTSNYNGAQISCNGGSNGTAMATASGGTAAYMYMWSNGQTTATATGLSAGAYSYTATDANNCTSSGNINVTEPTALMPVPDSFALDVLCNGDATGYVYVTIMGGTMPYTYAWSNGATTDDIVGLAAGVYSGTATDANGCVTGGVFTVTEPSLLTSSAMDNANGSATAAGSGGSPSYSYMWDAAAGNQTTATATGLMTGTYSVTVTDINGCSSVSSVNVVFTGVDHIATLNTLNIFPNPTNANVFVDLDLTDNQDVSIRIMNVTGQTVLETNVGTIQNQRVELNTSELSTGVYMVQFFIGTEMTTRKLVVDKR